jgi:hypothetical protein
VSRCNDVPWAEPLVTKIHSEVSGAPVSNVERILFKKNGITRI